MCTHKTQEAEKHLTTIEMATAVQIWAGHSAKESPEIVVLITCVNLKKMALLVGKHVGCGYTPGCGYAQPSPASLKHWPRPSKQRCHVHDNFPSRLCNLQCSENSIIISMWCFVLLKGTQWIHYAHFSYWYAHRPTVDKNSNFMIAYTLIHNNLYDLKWPPWNKQIIIER